MSKHNTVVKALTERIKEIELLKKDCMKAYIVNFENEELVDTYAALNMVYGMELDFLNKTLKNFSKPQKQNQ